MYVGRVGEAACGPGLQGKERVQRPRDGDGHLFVLVRQSGRDEFGLDLRVPAFGGYAGCVEEGEGGAGEG